MIKVYYGLRCTSSKSVLSWFENHYIRIKRNRIEQITYKELIKIIELSENGFLSILKMKNGELKKEFLEEVEDMSFNEFLMFLKLNPKIIRTPIIIQKNKVLIGYNSDAIRQFLPREHRRLLKKCCF